MHTFLVKAGLAATIAVSGVASSFGAQVSTSDIDAVVKLGGSALATFGVGFILLKLAFKYQRAIVQDSYDHVAFLDSRLRETEQMIIQLRAQNQHCDDRNDKLESDLRLTHLEISNLKMQLSKWIEGQG